MRIQSLGWVVWLLLGSAVAAGGHTPDYHGAVAAARSKSIRATNPVTQKSRFTCLPPDVQLSDVVSYGKSAKGNITVEKRLIEMKAQCRNNKLIDARRRQIRFFRPSCWGNPPPDYLEIQQRENSELQKLKRTFTVIVFGCDRTISKLITVGSLSHLLTQMVLTSIREANSSLAS